MAKKSGGGGIKSYSPKPGAKGLFGFTADAMAAQTLGLTGGTGTQGSARVAGDQAYAEAKFGGSLRGSIKKQFLPARAIAQQQSVILESGKDQLAKGVKTLADVQQIFKSGMAAQTMAAAAAKARAVQEATGASDSQTAAFAMELAKMKYAAQLQSQSAAKAAAQAQAQADAANGTALQASLQTLQSTAPVTATAASEAVNQARSLVDGDMSQLNVVDVQTDFFQKSGIDPASPEGMFAANVIQQRIMGKMTLDEALPLAMDKSFGGLPGYEQYGAKTANAIVTNIQSQIADRYVDDPGGDPPGEDVPIVLGQAGQTSSQLGLTVASSSKGVTTYKDAAGNIYRDNPISAGYTRIS